ncbi:MAG: carboxypeptidase-like regulatory domain-containing protein [Bacteroidota bacterium]
MKNQAKTYPLINSQQFLIFKRISLFLMLFFIFSHGATATLKNEKDYLSADATIKIKGKVTSDDEAMPGVNVYLKDTQIGTLTDKNGEFSFQQELKTGDVLVFSFLGYETFEYTITADTPDYISISMEIKSIIITGALTEDNQPKGIRKVLAKVKAIF